MRLRFRSGLVALLGASSVFAAHARDDLPPLLAAARVGNHDAALAAAHGAGLGSRVKGVRPANDELTLVLRRGLELRLGRIADVGMKLTIAREVLAVVEAGTTAYIDVSVPQRPVAG